MGYQTRVGGEITITPPLTAAEIRAVVEMNIETVAIRSEQQSEDVPEGRLTRFTGTAITAITSGPFKAYTLTEDVQCIVTACPGHEYTGRLDCAGDDLGDVWRLVVTDGTVTEIRPTWPGEE